MTIDLTYQLIAGRTVALKGAWLCDCFSTIYPSPKLTFSMRPLLKGEFRAGIQQAFERAT